MMSKSRKQVLAGMMENVKKETRRILKDLKALREDYEVGSQERLFVTNMFDEHETLFKDATAWFDDIEKLLANGKLEEEVYNEEGYYDD